MADLKTNFRKIAKIFRGYQMDYNLMAIMAFLILFGLLMVYSASTFVALRDYNDETHYFKRQLGSDVLGIVLMLFITVFPYQVLRKFCWLYYGFAFGFMLLILPFGTSAYGASRWVKLPFLDIAFQPSEAAKLLLILFLAVSLDRLGRSINDVRNVVKVTLFVTPILLFILLVTRNLSSAIIIAAIMFIMFFVASDDYKLYVGIVLVALVVMLGFTMYAYNMDSSENFRMRRIAAWIHPENALDENSEQTLNSLYAIGNGGLTGQGLGQSTQKISRLSMPQNDFIFAIICEELGVVGGVAVIVMFGLLLWRMYLVARNSRDRFGFLLVVGVMAHISVQVIVNIAVATNSIPNTGVTLPFISYGGTSAAFLLMEMGLVLSVDRYNETESRTRTRGGRR